jgi:hypothetical protein
LWSFDNFPIKKKKPRFIGERTDPRSGSVNEPGPVVEQDIMDAAADLTSSHWPKMESFDYWTE